MVTNEAITVDGNVITEIKDKLMEVLGPYMTDETTASILPALGFTAGGLIVACGESFYSHNFHGFFAGIQCGIEQMAETKGVKGPKFSFNGMVEAPVDLTGLDA